MILDASSFIEKNYRKNNTKIIKLEKDGSCIVKCTNSEQSSIELFQILSDIRFVLKVYGKKCNKIIIYIPNFNPRDKLVYVLLESVIYTLKNHYLKEVALVVENFSSNINTSGWFYTVSRNLVEYGDTNFNLYFQNDFSKNHYRKVLTDPSDIEAPTRLVTDIKTFLDRFHMKDEFDGKLAFTIGELVDNALNHANSPCLVDIDISEANYMSIDSEDIFYSLNVVVLNFSEKYLYDDIFEKIEHKYYKENSRYSIVKEAYSNHSSFWNKKYSKEDFFLVSAFQDEISGRPNESFSGGTGLAELIRVLEELSFENYCYVLTGKKSLLFKKDLLNYNSDGWIGFNLSRDYLKESPNVDCLCSSYTDLTGTGYNFMHIFKGEKDGE